MKNAIKLFCAGTLIVAVTVFAGCEKKQDDHAGHDHGTAVEQMPPVESTVAEAAGTVEQTTCPVMGGKINKDIFSEYKGKKVYFCCPACKPEFEKDPEKYISKLPQFQN